MLHNLSRDEIPSEYEKAFSLKDEELFFEYRDESVKQDLEKKMGRKGGHKKFNRKKRAEEGEEKLQKKVKTNEEGEKKPQLKKPSTKNDMKNAVFERYYRVGFIFILLLVNLFHFSK